MFVSEATKKEKKDTVVVWKEFDKCNLVNRLVFSRFFLTLLFDGESRKNARNAELWTRHKREGNCLVIFKWRSVDNLRSKIADDLTRRD